VLNLHDCSYAINTMSGELVCLTLAEHANISDLPYNDSDLKYPYFLHVSFKCFISVQLSEGTE
jgi:hypothetical protein